ncbi:MAG: CBS domain-containing protein [Candidatus Micrarchaeota archaeon]|nr:CBS domain-containing protein [Candidatus Micrarchaeota archaeon]
MKTSDLMRGVSFYLDSDAPIAYAAKKLVEMDVSEAPVVHKGKFIGMFLTSDLSAALVKTRLFGRPSAATASELQKQTVGAHLTSRNTFLAPGSDILSAYLLLIRRNVGAIPVVDNRKRLVGMVYASDLRKEMLKMISASGAKLPARAAAAIAPPVSLGGQTVIDQIVHYIAQKGSVSANDVAKHCNLTLDEVEDYASSLERNRLLRVEYDMLGQMWIKKPE